MLSVVLVLLKILNQLALQSVVMHEQNCVNVNFLGRNTVANSPATMQNLASHSQETVNFNAGTFSGVNVTIKLQMILYSLLRLKIIS